MNRLLARHAECLFWLGRYVERTASLSRILMVQTAFDRGRAEGTGWAWILTLYDEAPTFLKRYDSASGENVIRYYLTDVENTGSIIRSLSAARDNARALRALVSTDFWIQINRLYKRIQTLPESASTERRLAQTCEGIQTDCYALLGIAESTFYRDAGWRFFRLGVEIERADQMSRLLDVRFAQLQTGTAGRGEMLGDFAFWSMLLRACGGHHAYRRLAPGPLDPMTIARFLIFDQSFARSIAYSARSIRRAETELRTVCNVPTPAGVLHSVADLTNTIQSATSDERLLERLHTFNDAIQRALGSVARELDQAYFMSDVTPPSDANESAPPTPPSTPIDPPGQSQVQTIHDIQQKQDQT
ncbi:MAG: alpha-E domain-containing protein [Pseudomonadota bacterium]